MPRTSPNLGGDHETSHHDALLLRSPAISVEAAASNQPSVAKHECKLTSCKVSTTNTAYVTWSVKLAAPTSSLHLTSAPLSTSSFSSPSASGTSSPGRSGAVPAVAAAVWEGVCPAVTCREN